MRNCVAVLSLFFADAGLFSSADAEGKKGRNPLLKGLCIMP